MTRLLAATGALLITAGCTPNAPEPAPPPPPQPVERWGGLLSNLRMVWSAEPGIDLFGGPAVPVRAYWESVELAQSMGDIDFAYPGFTRAVLPDDPQSDDPSEWGRWPNTEIPLKQPLVGTLYTHILSLTASGRNVTAVVCRYDYTTAQEQGDGRFAVTGQWGKLRDVNAGINANFVKMTAPEDNTPHALPPQKGPAPAPSGDVFGDWRITGALNSFSFFEGERSEKWPSYEADLAACVDKAPDPPERRKFLIAGQHPRSDFPTKPAYPGWPAVAR
ncbi:hypothetical protein [Mycobacterium hubeiense]|uniref:hypothetical protein n=1 Tax=Mycobacterium hubeiense TaxID=1867256 RepID=UPI001E42B2DF|nr:hypothetical protein [Mycobacterium sp. QGD 101]